MECQGGIENSSQRSPFGSTRLLVIPMDVFFYSANNVNDSILNIVHHILVIIIFEKLAKSI